MTSFTTELHFVLLASVLLALAACGGAEERKERHLKRGQEFYTEGNYQKARVEFKNVLQIDPKDVEARFALAETLVKLQDWRAAAGQYLAVVEADAGHVKARISLGRLYLLGRATDRAIEMAAQALAISPNNPGALAVRAEAWMRQGDRAAAVDDARAALKEAPGHIQATVLLASLLVAEGETDEAKHLLEEGIAQNTRDTVLRIVLARILVRQGDVARAAELLREVMQLEPEQLVHPLRLAALYSQTKRPEEAEAVLRQTLTRHPDSLQVKLALVKLVGAQGGQEATERQLLAFIEQAPEEYGLRFALARVYEAAAQVEKAQAVYHRIIEADGAGKNGLAARNRLARILAREKRLKEAEALLAEVLKESPADNDALILRGDIALAKGDAVTAIADYRAVLRDNPEAGAVRRNLARAQLVNNEPELARDNLRKAVQAQPSNNQWRLELAQLQARADQSQEAIQQLEELLKRSPDDARALEALVQLQLRQGDLSPAAGTAERIKAKFPGKPLGYHVSGLIHQAHGEWDASIQDFELALERAPDAPAPLTALVRAYVVQKRPEAALDRLKAVLERKPGSTAAHSLTGEVMLVMQDFATAEASFQRAIELSPKLRVLYRNLAMARLGQGNAEGAVKAYTAGLKATDGASVLVVDLATLYEKMGLPDKAIEEYEWLLARSPDSDLAANNLAMLLATHRAGDAKSLERAHELAARLSDSDNPAFLDTIGWVAYKRGDLDRAIDVLEQVLQEAPDSPIIQYHLGAAYHQRGDKEVARQHLERALAAKAEFPGRAEAEVMLKGTAGG